MMDTSSWEQSGGGGVVNSSPPEACSTGGEAPGCRGRCQVRDTRSVGSGSYSTRLKYTFMYVFISRSWLHFLMSPWTSFSLWLQTEEWQRWVTPLWTVKVELVCPVGVFVYTLGAADWRYDLLSQKAGWGMFVQQWSHVHSPLLGMWTCWWYSLGPRWNWKLPQRGHSPNCW